MNLEEARTQTLPPDVQHWRRRRLAFTIEPMTPSRAGFEAFKRNQAISAMLASGDTNQVLRGHVLAGRLRRGDPIPRASWQTG